LLRFVQTNSLTLARQGDDLRYIRIWVTPPRRLVFWDGAPSPYTLEALLLFDHPPSTYESHFPQFYHLDE